MRRFYQESWQGIPFTTFAHTHFFHLADAKFYSVFYEELFRRYQSWEDLPVTWRANKTRDALWLAELLKELKAGKNEDRPLRVLSLGSGVGFMERMLIKEMGDAIELYVNEPSTVCMKWLRRLIPADRIFIGQPPDCLSPDIFYDMIYLSAVDYGIPQAQLALTLDHLRFLLLPEGEIVCLSASLLEEETLAARFVNFCKNCIRGVLHYVGIRKQQFWGWRRTREEYRQLFAGAGYKDIRDGFLDDGFNTYWIRGALTGSEEPREEAPMNTGEGSASETSEGAVDAAGATASETAPEAASQGTFDTSPAETADDKANKSVEMDGKKADNDGEGTAGVSDAESGNAAGNAADKARN